MGYKVWNWKKEKCAFEYEFSIDWSVSYMLTRNGILGKITIAVLVRSVGAGGYCAVVHQRLHHVTAWLVLSASNFLVLYIWKYVILIKLSPSFSVWFKISTPHGPRPSPPQLHVFSPQLPQCICTYVDRLISLLQEAWLIKLLIVILPEWPVVL